MSESVVKSPNGKMTAAFSQKGEITVQYLLDEALEKGPDTFTTFKISENITVHRRALGKRWIRPIDRSGIRKRQKHFSQKTQMMVHGSSTGEHALLIHLDACPWVTTFAEQCDLFHITDHNGEQFWSAPDVTAQGANGAPFWIEGKYFNYVNAEAWQRYDEITEILSKNGMGYHVVDQGWCNHPTVLENNRITLINRNRTPSPINKEALLNRLAHEPVSMENAAEVLNPDCPDYNFVFGARGRGELDFNVNKKVSAGTWVTKPFRPNFAVPEDVREVV